MENRREKELLRWESFAEIKSIIEVFGGVQILLVFENDEEWSPMFYYHKGQLFERDSSISPEVGKKEISYIKAEVCG